MIDELDNIKNPAIRIRIERFVVKPTIKAKQLFGKGIQCLK